MTPPVNRALQKRDRLIQAINNGYAGKSVLVAMSGGVDSSVAAYLLAAGGMKVIGIHFRLVANTLPISAKGCCHAGSALDVLAVCDAIGATGQVWDASSIFTEKVINYFEDTYLHGETPNPCIECNRELKWGLLWDRKQTLGIDFIASGHYARRVTIGKTTYFARGFDDDKDQAYALWPVSLERRAATLLPLGVFTKKEIRVIAENAKLPTAKAPESQDICFLGDTDYREWIRKRHPERVQSGVLQNESGTVQIPVENIYDYTIGQRKGLGGGYSTPQYVVSTDIKNSLITIGDKEQLYHHRIILRDTIGETDDSEYIVQVRYHDPGHRAHVTKLNDGRFRVDFETPVRAPACGQSAVAFRGDCVFLGGIIDEVLS